MQLKITGDNSHTLYVPELDEHYHSVHGAVQESEHIFIKNGLAKCRKKTLNILEVGFGTGLNAFLTYCYAQKENLNINYTGIEKYPVPSDVILELNYAEQTHYSSDVFLKLHKTAWEIPTALSDNFTLLKLQVDLLNFTSSDKFDLIYFDAFAPEKQSHLWTETVFQNLYNVLNINGMLVTYSAKGTVKQALRSAGFTVKRLAGPPGKRHILNTLKSS